ncbi:hypothetical protein Cv017_05395 [Chromobacterium subtsugae]|nr:hypothetical protein Cv017_05395 [Chromobacterium subtsugae]
MVAEDMVMAFRAFGAGGAVTIPEPLVLYRRGGTTYKKRHLTVEAVVSAFVKKLDNTKIELLHMIEVAGNKHATPALLTYLVNLYQKECLIEFMLRKQAGWMGRFKYLVDAPGVALSFKIRMFFYSLAPWALRPFFLLKRAVR